MKPSSALQEWVIRFRVPLFCAALLLFYAGRSRYASYAAAQRALDLTSPLVVSIQTKCAMLRGGTGCSRSMDRVLAYCSERVHGGDEGVTKPGSSSLFELHYVALTIRHGDRSAINSMPGALPHFDPEDTRDVQRKGKKGHALYGHNYLDTRALAFVPQLQGFVVKPLYSPEQAQGRDADIAALRGALSPPAAPIFQASDLRLAPGLLTTRGFMQHVELGRALGRAYAGLLRGVSSASNLKIRSTNYARTIQSVAALVLGMVPEIGGDWEGGTAALGVPRSSLGDGLAGVAGVEGVEGAGTGQLEGLHGRVDGRVVIESHLLEEVEVMHGVGLKLSSQGAGESGPEQLLTGPCAKSVSLAEKQKGSFVLGAPVLEGLEALFKTSAAAAGSAAKSKAAKALATSPIRDKFVTELADAAVPRLCHNEDLPCSSTGEGCMDEGLLGSLFDQADRAFCDRYTGSQGGLDATKLSIYPFLSEIIASLRAQAEAYDPAPVASSAAAATKAAKDKKRGPTEQQLKEERRVKMGIFSGHDTVIAPVLAGLGVYTGADCIWPPYASRIAFELWRPAPRGASEALAPADWHVRVVYNGREVTQRVPACVREAKARGGRSTSRTRMCSLDALASQVEGLIAPSATMADACKL